MKSAPCFRSERIFAKLFFRFFMRRVFSAHGTMFVRSKLFFNLFFIAGRHIIDLFALSACEFYQMIL